MTEKKLIDGNAFYVEKQRWGTWNSYDAEDNPILTSLTEDLCIQHTRVLLKLRQEDKFKSKDFEVSTYSGSIDYKL
jgi:hypothetical protein